MGTSKIEGKLKEAIDRYVASDVFGDDVREASLDVVVQALDKHTIELVDLVVGLEKPLNETQNPTARRMAVRLLGDCLGSSADLRLNGKHIQTFAIFFCSKLGDWQSIEGSVAGILVLLRRHAEALRQLTTEGPGKEPLALYMAKAFFKDVHTPSHAQVVRKSVLDVANLFLEEWKDQVTQLGEALGEGVGAMMEEERDPRNLLLSFALAKRLLSDYPESCCSEPTLASIFETLTSYFPITFTPPKDDKFGITGDDLRNALSRALASTPRLAGQVLPFLMEASQDITVGDAEDSIKQALEATACCLERYGTETSRRFAGRLLKHARDQVCRTTTPCPGEFADCLRRGLKAALSDIPVGLYPHWLEKEVDPELKTLAADSKRGGESLASKGSRHLLLAAAAAHPVLLDRVWGLAVTPLATAEDEGSTAALPLEVASFVLDAASLAERPGSKSGSLLSERQLGSVLASALEAMRVLPASKAFTGDAPPAPTLFKLLGRLCRFAGEEVPSVVATFAVLRSITFPGGDKTDEDAYKADWRFQLGELPEDSASIGALLAALCEVAGAQPARAAELAKVLLPVAEGNIEKLPAWLQNALPKLLAVSAMSLSRKAVGNPTGAEATAASSLMACAASFVCMPSERNPSAGRGGAANALGAVASALEGSTLPADAASWGAERLLEALRLPGELVALGTALGCAAARDAADGSTLAPGISAARHLVRTLGSRLPEARAAELRRRILSVASSAEAGSCGMCIALGLIPAALPAAAQEEWSLCMAALPAIKLCTSDEQHKTAEPLALEALEAIVAACPVAEVGTMLGTIKSQFGASLEKKREGEIISDYAARGAVRSWAATTAALLRHGKLAKEATTFLEALFAVLDRDAPATPFVPLAMQVLMPPTFGRAASSKAKLSPLALQQLSSTTLPSLLDRSKRDAKPGSDAGGRAALESTVALLCALPVEVACGEHSDALRWSALTCLKILRAELPPRAASGFAPPSRAGGREAGPAGTLASAATDGGSPIFAAQALQLLARACKQSSAWVEDDLHSVVTPLAVLCVEHKVPLVRLGSLQALHILIEQSYGHLLPFKKSIEAALRKAVEDKRREVRLMAVACLNAWHCGSMPHS